MSGLPRRLENSGTLRNIRVTLGLYGDNGKRNGNYYTALYRGYMGATYVTHGTRSFARLAQMSLEPLLDAMLAAVKLPAL